MKLSSNVYKHGYLMCLIFNGIILGIQLEILVPLLPSISHKLNVSYELISFLHSLSVIPNIISLSVIGIIHDTYPFLVPYLMIGECIILSVSYVIMPYTDSLLVFTLLFYLQNCALSCLNNGGQWNVLRLFKDKSVGKMQLYHLGYGIGAMLAGLICRPFLPSDTSAKSIKLTKYCSNLLNETSNQVPASSNMLNDSSNGTDLNEASTNNFSYAFLIAAGLDLISPIIFGLYHFLMPRPDDIEDYTEKKKEPLSKSINPKYFSPDRPGFGICMAILLFLFYFTYMTGMIAISPFMVVFATNPCKPYAMSQQMGATFSSVVSAAFLLGRIFSSFTVNSNPLMFLLVHNIISLASLGLLCVYGNDYAIALWIGMSVYRFVNGVNFPGGTSTFNRYIIVSGSFISLAFIGSTFGLMLGQNIGSIFIDNYPSMYFMYSGMIGGTCLVLVIVVVCVLSFVYGERKFPAENVNTKMKEIEESK